MRLFVDTNLLLDVLARREPFYAASARIWSLCETGACEGFVSAISFNNVYYIVRKARNDEVARKALVLMRDIFGSVAPDQQILNQAIDADSVFLFIRSAVAHKRFARRKTRSQQDTSAVVGVTKEQRH